MSAPNFTPIQLYRTATAAATPSAGNLADGELAINLTDEKLYFKNASGVVKLLASNSGSLGSVTSVNASGSTTGLTFSGGPITSSGTLTLGGTLVVGNGGTGSNTAAGARTNLGVPANDGTGATGTWGINVTGNAGTVTNGVYTTGNQTIGGLKTFSSTIYLADGGFVFNSDGAKDTGMSWASDGVMNVVCNGVTVGQFNSTGFTGNAGNVTGTVAVANGGTGATSLTSGYLLKGNGTSAVSSSVVYDTGTNVGIGTAAPGYKLEVQGNVYAASAINADGGINIAAGLGAYWRASLPSGAYQGGITYNGALRFYSGDVTTERVRIDTSGNVGIGTTSPQARLHVRPTTDVNMWVTNSGADLRAVAINDAVSAYIDSRYDANQHMFETSGSERVRITGAGNVGIGTSTPNAKLDVVGNVVMGAALITGTGVSTGDVQVELGANRTGDGQCYVDWHSTAGTDFEARIIRNSGANGAMDILNTGTGGINLSNFGSAAITLATGGGERMRITSTGNVGIGTSAPGYLLHLNQNGNTQAWISATNAGSNSAGIGLENQGQRNWQIWADRTNDALQFGNNNRATTNMAIKPTGQVRFVPLASAPSGAQAGDVYYDSSTNKLRCYNGTTWNDLF